MGYDPKGRLLWIDRQVGHEGGDCLFWPYHISAKGGCNVRIGGRRIIAQRHMCELKNGPPPTPKHEAAHSCGKGHLGCINPNHLRWATKLENERDKVAHGTAPRGERQNHAKLTAEQVVEIRSLSATHSNRELADRYGVTTGPIWHIVNRRTWRHLP